MLHPRNDSPELVHDHCAVPDKDPIYILNRPQSGLYWDELGRLNYATPVEEDPELQRLADLLVDNYRRMQQPEPVTISGEEADLFIIHNSDGY